MTTAEVDAHEIAKLDIAIMETKAAFRPLAAQFLRRGENTVVDAAIREFKAVTPVRTGKLQRSTVADTVFDGDLDAHIDIFQPATNTQGDQYAWWVINPHRTRGNTMTRGNPYPTEAIQAMGPIITAWLRRVGGETVAEAAHLITKK